jgi:hypothetical protein
MLSTRIVGGQTLWLQSQFPNRHRARITAQQRHFTGYPVIEVNPAAVGHVGDVDRLTVSIPVIEMDSGNAADATDHGSGKAA